MGLVLTTSLMALVYIWRVVEAAYFQEAPGAESSGGGLPGEGTSAVVEAPLALLIPTWGLIVANFYFGFDATFTAELAGSAARSLMGIAP